MSARTHMHTHILSDMLAMRSPCSFTETDAALLQRGCPDLNNFVMLHTGSEDMLINTTTDWEPNTDID